MKMFGKKMTKAQKPKDTPLKPLEELKWEDDNFVNHTTVYNEGKTEGIAVKTAQKIGAECEACRITIPAH